MATTQYIQYPAINILPTLVLYGSTSGTITLKAPATVTSYSVTFPNAQGTGALTNDGSGNLSWTPAASTTLTSAHLFVGNGSNVATDVAVSGDLTLANTGSFSVAKIAGTTVSGTSGTTNVVFSANPAFTGSIGFGTTSANTNSIYSSIAAFVTATSTPTIAIAGYGSSQLFNQIIGYGARGTEGSPTTVQADDQILWMGGKGYVTGTGFIAGAKGVVAIAAESIWTASSTPTYVSIYTTPNASTTRAEAIRVNSSGQIANKIAGNEFAGSNQTVVMGGADGPAGVTLSKISGPTKWLKILDSGGAASYIPLYQ